MTAIPPEPIQAAAIVLHDEACDADTKTCGRWNSKVPGGYDPQKHIGYYEDRAREVLEAAEAVWPHTPLVRSPESTVAAVTDRAPSPSFRRPPARPARPFGFGRGADA